MASRPRRLAGIRPTVLREPTAAPGTAKRREQDRAMIEHPSEWPAWPTLPLKAYGPQVGPELAGMEYGVMLAVQEWLRDKPTVFLTAMWGLSSGTYEEAVEGIERKEYDDLDALLDYGWTVD